MSRRPSKRPAGTPRRKWKASMSGFGQWVHGRYHGYLERKETDGGWCDEWTTETINAALSDPNGSGYKKAAAEMIAKACQQVWHQDPEPDPFDLFAVAGVAVERSYTYHDPAVTGGYRRVSARWATLRHAQGDAAVKRAKADQAVAEADRAKETTARLFIAVGGDPDTLLWDHRDTAAPLDPMSPPDPPAPERPAPGP